MKPRRSRGRQDSAANASDLSQMGRCERQVVFERIHGIRRGPVQEAARQRGLAAHARFEREGRRAIRAGRGAAGRCFIATMVFGDAWQTEALRDFRDAVLRPRPWGRVLVLTYYRVGPHVCSILRACPALQGPVRWILEKAIRLSLVWRAGGGRT